MKLASACAVIAMLAVTFVAGTAMAQQTNLIVATLTQEEASLPQKFFIPWSKVVEQASQGTLKMDIRNGYSIATLGNSLDRLNDDVVQVTLVVFSTTAAQFPLVQVATLPFVNQKATDAGIALWRLYKDGSLDSEMKNYVPIVFSTFSYNSLHLVKAPKSLDDLAGLRIVTSSRLLSDMTKQLGGAPSSLTPMDAYPALQRGAYDGILTAWPSITSFHIMEVTSYHVDVPLGATPYLIAMTRKRYEALPPAARKAIDDNSGETWSRTLAAEGVDAEVDRAHAVALAQKHTIVPLDPQHVAMWKEKTKTAVADAVAVIASHPGGQAVMDKFPKLLTEIDAGH
jgi:TRAP-type C4-dicarboxylate transport system substrate-binding protein